MIARDQQQLAERAQAVIPGGVNSANRVLPWPLVTKDAQGAYFTDVDGKRYLDYHAAFGPLILGHNHPGVNAAVHAATNAVDLIGAGVTVPKSSSPRSWSQLVPSAERVLLTNSGSEATYAALRLARAVTGRNSIVKFQGTYHGWHDAVLMNVISAPDKIGQQRPAVAGDAARSRRAHDRAAVQRCRSDCRYAAAAWRRDRRDPGRGHSAQHRLRAAAARIPPALRDADRRRTARC